MEPEGVTFGVYDGLGTWLTEPGAWLPPPRGCTSVLGGWLIGLAPGWTSGFTGVGRLDAVGTGMFDGGGMLTGGTFGELPEATAGGSGVAGGFVFGGAGANTGGRGGGTTALGEGVGATAPDGGNGGGTTAAGEGVGATAPDGGNGGGTTAAGEGVGATAPGGGVGAKPVGCDGRMLGG